MILPILAAVLMLAETPAAAPAPAPAPTTLAPIATPAPVQTEGRMIDPIAEINTLMEAWKGKAGDPLRGRLGLSYNRQPATNGEVVFWRVRADSVGCGVGADGVMRCGSAADWACQLGVAFDKAGKITAWKADGAPEACVKFVALLDPDK